MIFIMGGFMSFVESRAKVIWDSTGASKDVPIILTLLAR
jgi:hypothetical protein